MLRVLRTTREYINFGLTDTQIQSQIGNLSQMNLYVDVIFIEKEQAGTSTIWSHIERTTSQCICVQSCTLASARKHRAKTIRSKVFDSVLIVGQFE